MRVAQVMECTIGGTRRHINELCRGLADRSFDVTLYASAVRDPTFHADLERIRAAGVRVVEIPFRRAISPLHDLAHQFRLLAEVGRGRFDVVHTHSSKAGVLGRVAALVRGRGAPLVHTPHTFAFNFTGQFGAGQRRLFLAIERWLGRRTARLVHVSESEREEAVALGIVPVERSVVIPNGIDPAPFRAASGAAVRAELGLAEDTPLVGTVGLLNEAKGHSFLIDAAARVRAELPRAVFVIAGEGALRSALERRIAAAGLAGGVRLLGYRADVPEICAALDLFVMPSLWEGMPYVLLEAMAAGRAVVASDVNGCRDLVASGETGLLVPAAAAEPLAAAIVRLLRDRDLRCALGSAGARRVAETYSLATMLDRYAALYRSLSGSRS